MQKVVCSLLLVCVTQVLAKPSPVDPYVIGGFMAVEKAFPFAVSINSVDKEVFCGGAILSKRYILTAAHCVHERSVKTVLVGTGSVHLEKQTFHKVEKITTYPEYTPDKYQHDIGIVKLKKDLEFSDTVQPIKFNYTKNADDKNVTAMGWGRTSTTGDHSERLLYLNKTTISNSECIRRIESQGFPVFDSNICMASEKDEALCFGDSGSPLFYKEENDSYVLGVVSWGIPCALGYPDVFTRVSTYINWIKETMNS